VPEREPRRPHSLRSTRRSYRRCGRRLMRQPPLLQPSCRSPRASRTRRPCSTPSAASWHPPAGWAL